jgi:hypothetical protein
MAVVAESVLFQLPLPQVITHARAQIRPGGSLAFSEAVWTTDVTPTMSGNAGTTKLTDR